MCYGLADLGAAPFHAWDRPFPEQTRLALLRLHDSFISFQKHFTTITVASASASTNRQGVMISASRFLLEPV